MENLDTSETEVDEQESAQDEPEYTGTVGDGRCCKCSMLFSETNTNFRCFDGVWWHDCLGEEPKVSDGMTASELNKPYQAGAFSVTVERWPVVRIDRDGKRARYIRTSRPLGTEKFEFLGIYGPHAILRRSMCGEYRFSVTTGAGIGITMRDFVIERSDLRKLRKMKHHRTHDLSFAATEQRSISA